MGVVEELVRLMMRGSYRIWEAAAALQGGQLNSSILASEVARVVEAEGLGMMLLHPGLEAATGLVSTVDISQLPDSVELERRRRISSRAEPPGSAPPWVSPAACVEI